MLDEDLVLIKTRRGAEEISSAGRTLSARLRRALILVDGSKTVADLAPMFRPGEIDAVLAELASGGFVAPAGEAAAVEPAHDEGAQVARHATGAISTERFEEVRRRAAREISDRLGPNGDVLALRVEGCRTPDELRIALRETEQVLGSFLGAEYGRNFARKIGADLV